MYAACVYVSVSAKLIGPREGGRSPGTGFTGSVELPKLGAESLTMVLFKNSVCS